MKRDLWSVLSLVVAIAPFSFSQTKPVVLIAGSGNISINSTGQAVGGIDGGVGAAAGSRQTSVNKHDQTMEMAQDFLRDCPDVELTLSHDMLPDYFVALNREGQATMFGEMGQSQIMVLNRRKSVIFVVSKKAKVSSAVRSACTAIAADWQANGRIAVETSPASVAATPTNPIVPPPTSQPSTQPTPSMTQPVLDTVAVEIHTTASANKYCKAETIASVLSDTNAYLTSKGWVLGKVATSKKALVLIVDRPFTKFIEITVQGRDMTGNLLWSEKVSAANSWTGSQALLDTMAKVHLVIDTHL